MSKITISWEVEDGYAGGSRPHRVSFDPTNYIDEDETWEEISQERKDEIINDIVETDFEQTISFVIRKVELR